MKQIVIDGTPYNFAASDLPLMIHGNEKAGASLFSVNAAVSICKSGNTLFFWSAYPMAKEEFYKEVGAAGPGIRRIKSADEITGDEPRILVMEDESPEALSASLHKIDANRVLFVKNFEVLPEELRKELLKKELLVIAGDLKGVLAKEEVQRFRTQASFSLYPDVDIPAFQKYEGFIVGRGKIGLLLS